jgi:hypothetical protein
MNNNKMPVLLGALALCVAAPASAALYRCGNVFQDRPCEVQGQQEVLRPGGSASPQGAGAARRPASAPAAQGSAQPAREPASSTAAAAAAPASHAASSPAEAASSARPAASAPTSVVARKGRPSLACGNLREQHAAIEGRLQTAKRPETIQMYERQLRDVERNLDEGNCR